MPLLYSTAGASKQCPRAPSFFLPLATGSFVYVLVPCMQPSPLSRLLCPHSLSITQDGALRSARSISAVPTTKIPMAIVPQSGSSPRGSDPAAGVLADLGRNLAGSKSHCVPTSHINSFTMVHATSDNVTLRLQRLTRLLNCASVGERIAPQLRFLRTLHVLL